MTVDWRASEEFALLCDLAASDHLVALTGAGISRGMTRADGNVLPGWIGLLQELLARFRSELDPADAASAERLLDDSVKDPPIGSSELILAASLIRTDATKDDFDREFRAAITEVPGQTSETHRALLDLVPRGIMTFNYDGGHETAIGELSPPRPCTVLNPTADDADRQFREAFEGRMKSFFLLKAHGSTDSTSELVLTTEAYRGLLVHNTAFRAFVQNLFTNFSFLMVGYGLDDPDFDLFLRTMAEQFAGPLQHHVVLRPERHRTRRDEIERRQFGIRSLYVNDFGDYPEVIRAAATTAGPALKRTLDLCLSEQMAERGMGHQRLRELGAAGRHVAGEALKERLGDTETFTVAEAAYSLGVLDGRAHKATLCELVDSRNQSDILGRALTMLRSEFTPADLPLIEKWRDRYDSDPPAGDRPERIKAYLDYLASYVEHKHQSDPPAAASA